MWVLGFSKVASHFRVKLMNPFHIHDHLFKHTPITTDWFTIYVHKINMIFYNQITQEITIDTSSSTQSLETG